MSGRIYVKIETPWGERLRTFASESKWDIFKRDRREYILSYKLISEGEYYMEAGRGLPC